MRPINLVHKRDGSYKTDRVCFSFGSSPHTKDRLSDGGAGDMSKKTQVKDFTLNLILQTIVFLNIYGLKTTL